MSSCTDVLTITESVIAGIMILAGLPICLSGKKFFRPLLTIVGFCLGWWAAWAILSNSAKRCTEVGHDPYDPDYALCPDNWAGIILQIVGGFIGSALLFKFFKLGVAVLSGLAGAIGTAFLYNLIIGWVNDPYDEVWLFWTAVGVGCVLAVLASAKFFNMAFMIATAFIGAYFLYGGIDHFLVLADKYGGPDFNGECYGSVSLSSFWDAASQGFDCKNAGIPAGEASHICYIMISFWVATAIVGFFAQRKMPPLELDGKHTQQENYRPMSSQV